MILSAIYLPIYLIYRENLATLNKIIVAKLNLASLLCYKIIPRSIGELYLMIFILLSLFNIISLASGLVIDYIGFGFFTKTVNTICTFGGLGSGSPTPDPSGGDPAIAASLQATNSSDSDDGYVLPRIPNSTNIVGMLPENNPIPSQGYPNSDVGSIFSTEANVSHGDLSIINETAQNQLKGQGEANKG